MSDLASSRKNFIIVWNSCCLNSFSFIYCLSLCSWQLHWPLTFSSKFSWSQGFILLSLPVCLPVHLLQSLHITNDSNSVIQYHVENLKKIPIEVKIKQQTAPMLFFFHVAERPAGKDLFWVWRWYSIRQSSSSSSFSSSSSSFSLSAADITVDITSSVHVSVCSA